jgi:AraC-like DNA-binding protein
LAGELERRSGAVSIGALRDRTGWSKSRFTALFREQVGVAPKTLARVLRFRRALELVHREEGSLLAIALAAGYYDQAHFNAEFRRLSGFAPTDYLARSRYPESVNLAESAG